jgi:hypothetical protein
MGMSLGGVSTMQTRFALLLSLGLSVTACDGGLGRRAPVPQPSPVPSAPEPAPQPPPLPPPSPPPAGTRLIAIGEVVKDTTSDAGRRFAIVPSADGVLVIQLSWDDRTGVVLRLTVDDVDIPEGCCNWGSPVIARVNVRKSQQVRIAVSVAGTIWDYARVSSRAGQVSPDHDGWTVDFVLGTSME